MKKKFFRFRVLYGIIFINAFFIIVSASIILSSMWINSEKNARELSAALIEEIRSSLSNRTLNYFEPAENTNQSLAFLLYHYFEDPIKNAADTEKTFEYYAEILKINPQFKMLYYSDTEGNLVMLNRMNDGSFSRRYVYNTEEAIQIRWSHASQNYYGAYPDINEPVETGYDPRKRSWYQMAVEQKSMIWTPVYLFATDHLPGFTCAIPVFDEYGAVTGISSVDIAVDELSRFLGTIHPTPGTTILILDKQNNLVALQAQNDDDLEKLFEKTLDAGGYTLYNVSGIGNYPDEAVRYIVQETLQDQGGMRTIAYQGSRYVSSLTPITVGNGLELSIGIIVPEDDIVGNVRRNLIHVTLFSIVILVLILVVSSMLSQAIAKPMRVLSEEMAKIKTFELDSEVDINTGLLEILDMRESFESMRSGLKNFKRYVPSDLVAQLINDKVDAGIGGEKRELTMFFSDIARFTSISEKTMPENLVADLCLYFELISKTILSHKGTIDKYIGDSVMAFWGAPVRMQDHAQKACESAIFIHSNLRTLFRQWDNQGKAAFNTRIGIHTGEVIVGNMGYEERLNYTVIGDSVNVASRLEGINKVYGTEIIVSEFTRDQCRDAFEFRRLDRVSVVGRQEAFDIYELIAIRDDIDKSLKKIYQFYETGLQCYLDRNWDQALKYFLAVLKYRPSDSPSKVMRERCLTYRQNPPPKEWNGVFIQSHK
ncbi:MAG: adenylate/guanylate cyclase domain-containing protein [Treponema sp.]|jgi:adenylate cyclase|nr:adenylate/guanylate cyclase domain-containing protein [Treponema sp.]